MNHRTRNLWIIGIGVVLFIIIGCTSGILVSWLLFSTSSSTPAQAPTSVRREIVAATPVRPPTPAPLPITSGVNELESQIESVYQRVGPSVVNITSRSFELDFFMRPVPREGSGSGFFYDTNGHIVTNYHVIQNAEDLHVTLSTGEQLPAQIVGSDPSNDLAVIRIETTPADVSPISFADSAALQVGQFVVAIGNPFGLKGTLTLGVVSSLGRVIESPNERFIGEVIQTDAAVNPGNSGGPLLDLSGALIGVNSAILSPSGASAGIGFAIPSRTVQRVVPALIEQGRYPHPSLGVQLYELIPESVRLLRRAGMEVPIDRGLLVIKNLRRDRTDTGLRGGVRQVRVGNMIVPVGGDIILAINGVPAKTYRDVIVYLETQTFVGDTVNVTVIRDGKEQTVPVLLVEL